MFDNEHFIRSPLLLRVDAHIARFAGYKPVLGKCHLFIGPADLDVDDPGDDGFLSGEGEMHINARKHARK